MTEAEVSGQATGTVYLVGAGPGAPDLLTLRAAELLARAEVIVCDSAMNPAVLERYAPRTAVVMPAGQVESGSGVKIALPDLLDLASIHSTVVRLVVGDATLAESVREAMEALAAAGVAFEVVPGVPLEIAVPAFAGIPLCAGEPVACVFLPDAAPEETGAKLPPPSGSGGSAGAVVAVNKSRSFDGLAASLLQAGWGTETPVAAISSGGLPGQRTLVGTLGSLATLQTPQPGTAVVVVGEVVRQRERLAWFEKRPLFGRRIAVTRPRAQASGLVASLEALGAEVVPFPTIRIQPAADPEPLRKAAREVGGFDWIVFTSVNGVSQFWETLREVGRDTRSLAGVSVCAIGPATAAALNRVGITADLVPERFVAEAVLEALDAAVDLAGLRVLLPRAELARAVLPDELRARRAEVVEVVAYQTLPDEAGVEGFRERLQAGSVDLVTFTASSTVQNFVELLGTQIGHARVASIGPITSATARRLGLSVHVEAEEYTVPGLVRAIVEHYQEVQPDESP